MKTIDTRFGPIQYDPERTITFIGGMVGFEHLKHFVLVPTTEDDFLTCLQSVEDKLVAFLLVDPFRYFPSYTFSLSEAEKARLTSSSEDELLILTTITVHADQSISLNLAAPVLLSPVKNLAMQVVLEDGSYSSREPLPQTS